MMWGNEVLDVRFYRSVYPDLQGLSARRLRNHWKLQGYGEGRFPNRESLAAAAHAKGIDSSAFNAADYLAANLDLPPDLLDPDRAFHHYVTMGFDEQRPTSAQDSDEGWAQSAGVTLVSELLASTTAHDTEEQIALIHYLIKRTSLSSSEIQRLAADVDRGRGSLEALLGTWFREEAAHLQHGIERQESVEHLDTDTREAPPPQADVLPIPGSSQKINVADWHERLAILNESAPETVQSGRLLTEATRSTPELAPSVTVLVSLYRADEDLEAFLDNLERQHLMDQLEIVFLLAEPSPHVARVVRTFRQRYPLAQVHEFRRNITIYEAWNHGIRTSTSPYITNANVDDTRRQDSMSIQKCVLDEHPEVDVVYQDYFVSLEPHLQWDHYEQLGYRTSMPLVRSSQDLDAVNAPHCAPMWRRRLHDEVGYFDGAMQSAGDYDFWYRCALHGKRFHKSPEIHAAYFANPSGMSTKSGGPAQEEAEQVRRRYWWLSHRAATPSQEFDTTLPRLSHDW